MSSEWTIIVYLNRADLALAAAKDALSQDTPDPRVLIINNGGSSEDREMVEKFCLFEERALCWSHDPPLPSLSATWNRALRFVWECGATKTLVANHDVRMTRDTWSTLELIMDYGPEPKALLVTATGVEEEETLFEEAKKNGQKSLAYKPCPLEHDQNPDFICVRCRDTKQVPSKGGPGFSLFMISKEGHEKYPFDEMLTPAFTEDLMYHRTAILQGDGDRVFGTNVRYLHLGGQTMKNMSPEQRVATEEAISRGARAHYARVWGGGANEEKWVTPFNTPNAEWDSKIPDWIRHRVFWGESVTTPALFEAIRAKW